MPDWTSDIPPAKPYDGIPLLRTPPAGAIAGTILSDNIIGTMTHWAGGRTQPHERDNCLLCANKVPYRFHAYLAFLSDRNGRQAVIELTAGPAEILRAWRIQHITLRGTHFVARRTIKRSNGKVAIDLSPGTIAPAQLPTACNCAEFMSAMWNIAEMRMHHRLTDDGRPHIDISPDLPIYVSDDLPPQITEACAHIINRYTGDNGKQPPPAA